MHGLKFQDPYQIIHLVLAVIIVMILLYSLAYAPGQSSRHPIPSSHEWLFSAGHTPASKGMSRAFSAIVRFDFQQARHFNPFSLKVFAFFFGQLWMRILFCFWYARRPARWMVWADITASLAFFMWSFWDLFGHMYG